jgi:hypothetical protein
MLTATCWPKCTTYAHDPRCDNYPSADTNPPLKPGLACINEQHVDKTCAEMSNAELADFLEQGSWRTSQSGSDFTACEEAAKRLRKQKLFQACELAAKEICGSRMVDPNKALLLTTIYFSEAEIADVIYRALKLI